MNSNQKRWLHYALVAVALAASVASLFALFELGAPRWTTPLNILSLLCIVLAMRVRAGAAGPRDH